MKTSYDLVVVGAGSAGLSAARFGRQLGARVALIDRELPGGDCLRSGCVPSKTLIKAAKVAWEIRRADRFGLTGVVAPVDLGRVNAHVQKTIDTVYQFERPEMLSDQGIDFFSGNARFSTPDLVLVGDRALKAGHTVICTGARPVRPPLPGLDQTPYLTYEDVFQLDTLPPGLIVLGTGPVGVELAQAFQRLGSTVTLIGRSGRLLGKADPAIQILLEEALRDDGVDLRLNDPPERIEATSPGRIEVITARDTMTAPALLVAVGRRPNVDDLQLDRAGVASDARGITVDERLRTTNRRIFACGDVIGGPQFSHYAAWQGYVAVRNALLPGTSHGVLATVPWAVFTDPEVATVGLTEPEARARFGNAVLVRQLELGHVDRAQTDAEVHGIVKVVLRPDGTILGAHVVAARAGEMISEYVLAMNHRIPFDRLASSIHVYPTYTTATQQLAAQFWTERLLGGLKGRILQYMVRRARPGPHDRKSPA